MVWYGKLAIAIYHVCGLKLGFRSGRSMLRRYDEFFQCGKLNQTESNILYRVYMEGMTWFSAVLFLFTSPSTLWACHEPLAIVCNVNSGWGVFVDDNRRGVLIVYVSLSRRDRRTKKIKKKKREVGTARG